ncbi:hypothetical protein M9458_022618, partial [Cirrhinus mrigala]
LEKQLANERIRLGELRKKHYEMGGIPMDSPPENSVNSFDSSLPTVFPDPPTMELPSLDAFTLDPPRFEPLRLDPPRLEPPAPAPAPAPAPEPAKTSSKRTSIFQKSGSRLKNA